MSFYDKLQSDAEEQRAEALVKEAKKIAKHGDIKNAIPLYKTALSIFIDIGNYLRLSEIFDNLLTFVISESELITLIEHLQDILLTVEYLDIPEEEAHLKLSLANLAYKNKDYKNAGRFFENVAELSLRMYFEDAQILSGTNYIRAAECFEKINKNDRAERLILKGMRAFDISNFNYQDHFTQIQDAIETKDFNSAIDEIDEIIEYLKNLIRQVSKYISEDTQSLQNLKVNSKARLKHMRAEFEAIKMVCFKRLDDEEGVEKIALENIKRIIDIIQLQKVEFEDNFFTTADLHRLTFDLLLLQFFQEFAKIYEEDPVYLLTSGLSSELKKILLKMKFYKYTMDLLEFNIDAMADIIHKIPLSQILSPFRDFISDSLE